ncbi:Wzz/FepE/Etk N-terminal domain-containing protein [Ectothiorhodosinus mongolicus]|nr:Wzz/FepE/Etk N-terminal domain-containing protein [Ectothiorhodosinus mongolicus]
MSAQNTPPATYDDEIDLYELWEMLVSRKWTAIGTALVIFLSGIGYALTQPTLYEYQTIITVAQAPDPVRPPADAVFHFSEVVFPEKLSGVDLGVSIQRQGDNRLVLKTTAQLDQAEQVRDLHQSAVNEIADYYLPTFTARVNARLSEKQARGALLSENIQALEAERRQQLRIMDERQDAFAMLALQRVSLIDQQLISLRQSVQGVEQSINQFLNEASRDTELDYLALRSGPVGTQPRLIIALAAVLGVMLGIFLVFVTQFFANARKAR